MKGEKEGKKRIDKIRGKKRKKENIHTRTITPLSKSLHKLIKNNKR